MEIDLADIESVFGLGTPQDNISGGGGGGADAQKAAAEKMSKLRRRSSDGTTASSASAAAVTQLLPAKRASNVEIAISRMRLSDEQIAHAILHPAASDGSNITLAPALSAETVAALLSVLPTSEELETIRSHVSDGGDSARSSLGRVERFFLSLGEVPQVNINRAGSVAARRTGCAACHYM